MTRTLGVAIAAGLLTTGLVTGEATARNVSPASVTDGVLDRSFGADGIVTTAIDAGPRWEVAEAVTVQDNGRIVVAGTFETGPDRLFDIGVVRYLRDGRLDPTFGDLGVATTPDPAQTSNESVGDVAVQDDGRILVVGSSPQPTSGDDVAVVRFTTSGALDTTFGVGGTVITPIGAREDIDVGSALAVQSDGRIVVVGTTYPSFGGSRVFAVRYDPDGSIDRSFGVDGYVRVPINRLDDRERATDVTIDSLGRIVIVGQADSGGASGRDSLVIRLLSDGSVDRSFGGRGFVLIDCDKRNRNDSASGVAVDRSGRIVIVGHLELDVARFEVVVARLSTDGTLDPSFAVDGTLAGAFGTNSGLDLGRDVTLQADGKIVVTGTADMGRSSSTDVLVMRLRPDGGFDRTFGGVGWVTTAIAAGDSEDGGNGVAIQPNGRIVVAGLTYAGDVTRFDIAVSRYLATPSLTRGASLSADALLRRAIPEGSTVRLTRSKASKNVCKVVDRRVVGTAPGSCTGRLRVTMPATEVTPEPATRRLRYVVTVTS